MKTLTVLTTAVAALAAAAATAAPPPPTLTLAASTTAVLYGGKATLSGTLSNLKANQTISVQAQQCGTTKFARTGMAKTDAKGAYTLAVTPTVATSYKATWKTVTSNTITVGIKPLLQLQRLARGSYSAKVTAGMDLKGKATLFQRYSTLRKRWVQVKRVVLTSSAPGTSKPTVVASASFSARVARRVRVRIYISAAQAAPCYLSAASNVLRA